MAKINLPASFFTQTGKGRYEPTEATVGPWSPDYQHGGPPSALLTNALRLFPSAGNLKIVKIAIEFFGAIPMNPCEIKIEKVRGGKRVELLSGQYISHWTFVPVDMTVGLYRHPIGPWIGMAARTSMGNEGIEQTTSIAFDTNGSLGRSMHTLFVRPR